MSSSAGGSRTAADQGVGGVTGSRRATSADVAKLAGVSRATVSYVLNGRSDQSIPETTRQRVLAAAAELDYTPNVAARTLRAGQSRLVLLVNEAIPMGRNLARIVDALGAQAEQDGRSLVLWQRRPASGLASTLTHLAPCLTITLGTLADSELALLASARIPVLAAGLGTAVDPAYGGVPAVAQIRHLAARGHRRIGLLSTDDPALRHFATPRVEGARNACDELGLPEPKLVRLPSGEGLTVTDVALAVADWRRGPVPITAVACYNDYFATACLAAAAELGLSVPEDLAVMGIDDEVFARFTQPPLTTVRMDNLAFAAGVWSRAQHLLRGEADPGATTGTAFELVVRGST